MFIIFLVLLLVLLSLMSLVSSSAGMPSSHAPESVLKKSEECDIDFTEIFSFKDSESLLIKSSLISGLNGDNNFIYHSAGVKVVAIIIPFYFVLYHKSNNK